MDKEKHKAKMTALTLLSKGSREHRAVYSFEELHIPFQAPIAMDLRALGVIHFGMTDTGAPGVYLAEPYASMSFRELHNALTTLL